LFVWAHSSHEQLTVNTGPGQEGACDICDPLSGLRTTEDPEAKCARCQTEPTLALDTIFANGQLS
jgi:hypothetical protein